MGIHASLIWQFLAHGHTGYTALAIRMHKKLNYLGMCHKQLAHTSTSIRHRGGHGGVGSCHACTCIITRVTHYGTDSLSDSLHSPTCNARPSPINFLAVPHAAMAPVAISASRVHAMHHVPPRTPPQPVQPGSR